MQRWMILKPELKWDRSCYREGTHLNGFILRCTHLTESISSFFWFFFLYYFLGVLWVRRSHVRLSFFSKETAKLLVGVLMMAGKQFENQPFLLFPAVECEFGGYTGFFFSFFLIRELYYHFASGALCW